MRHRTRSSRPGRDEPFPQEFPQRISTAPARSCRILVNRGGLRSLAARTLKKPVPTARSIQSRGIQHSTLRESLAGAVGFEPTPSALTVRCPTGWTTPQQFQNVILIPKKIVGVRKTRKPAAKKYYSVFSVGNPASFQARQPPSIEMQFT